MQNPLRGPRPGLPVPSRVPMLSCMFVVTEAEAAAIRAAFDQGGELAAAAELRRLFPGITNNAEALACARTIAGWKPLELPRRLPVPLRRPSRGV